MKTSSTARSHRERRADTAPVSPAFAAAAAFVVATAFGAFGLPSAGADVTWSTPDASRPPAAEARPAPASQGAVLNLQIGKIIALALPDGAVYSLRSAAGELLDGSQLQDKPQAQAGDALVHLLARDGLLCIEAAHVGQATLVIEAPRQSTQRFSLRISAENVTSEIAPAPPKIASSTTSVSRTAVSRATPVKPVAKISSVVKSGAPSVSIVSTKANNATKPVSRSSFAAIQNLSKPVSLRATTMVLAQIAPPIPTFGDPAERAPVSRPPIIPDVTPGGDTGAGTVVYPPRQGAVTPLEDVAGFGGAPQISPIVPAPSDTLPTISIPYQPISALPADVAREVNDPSKLRPMLSVSTGMARVLAFKQNILSVFYSDENVMDARAINARTLAVTGKGTGKSTLAIFLARTPGDVVGRAVIYNIDVYPSTPKIVAAAGITDPAVAREMIETALNDPRVNVSVIQRLDGALVAVLTGTLRDKSEIDAAVSTAGLFVPNVTSSLYVDAAAISLPDALGNSRFSSEGILQSKLRGILGNDSIVITALPGGTTLTASVGSAGEAEQILGVLPFLDRKIQPIIVVRGAPEASRYYNSERPVLFGEDYEMTRRLSEVTGLDSVYAVRTARNAIAIYGTVRDRTEYDRLRRYSLLLPQLQEAAIATQTAGSRATPVANAPSSAAVTSSVSAQAPALSAVSGTAPVPSTAALTGLQGSNMPINGYQFPTQIQLFVRLLDENAAAVRLVTVDSSVVEISRNALKDLGVQFGSATLLSGDTAGGGTTTVDTTFNQGTGLLGDLAGTGGFRNINPIRARVAALYQKGAARVLSNPNLTAVEGHEAQITIGGSRPVPSTTSTAAAGGSNQTSIEFRRFGIILTMRPTVADDDTIILQIRGDVTDLDFTTGITLGNTVIPGERVRSVDTVVTLREGDTLVLGGLITNESRKQTSKVPFLGDLPFIGKLFQSKRFENNETELAIFLTPSIRRQKGSEGLREIIMATPSFSPLSGVQEDNAFNSISTIDNNN